MNDETNSNEISEEDMRLLYAIYRLSLVDVKLLKKLDAFIDSLKNN